MKCVSCGSENQIKADYCKFCGEKFSEDTKKAAYGKTVYGRIDRFLEMKSWITLGKITGNPIVRILIILLLAVLVFVNIRANGSSLTIKDKADYDLAYNPELAEYYVMTDLSEVDLSVYVPKKTADILLNVYNGETLLNTSEIVEKNRVTVTKNAGWRYSIVADYENGSSETITFFVCGKEAEQ